MYLWHILSRDKSELIHRVYDTQKNDNSIGDWVRLVEENKNELGISMTDQEIQGVSKEVFKTFVHKKVKINHLEYLNNLKKKHSKSTHLYCRDLKMAEYLIDAKFNSKKKQLLFKLRSRTLYYKQNFKNDNQNPLCTLSGPF